MRNGPCKPVARKELAGLETGKGFLKMSKTVDVAKVWDSLRFAQEILRLAKAPLSQIPVHSR